MVTNLFEIVLCLDSHIVVVSLHRVESHLELAHQASIVLLIIAHLYQFQILKY